MALRDQWHRTLVYFGLAEEEAYEDDYEPYSEPEVQMQDTYRERPTVRRLPQSRRRRDDYDDIFAEEEPSFSRPTATLRPVASPRSSRQSFHFVAPKNFNDVQDVGDKFKASIPVILNLQNADHDLAKRLIDFVSGLTYALDGGMQRIADKVFLLTPEGVQLSAEERASLASNDFFNQS
ncbi:MAG TPA: cell division protein SepF [Solirubrobacteraceae bacterium]|nr:cell division protein SepF [Solirubrobacteraceae bacterium]